MDHRLGTWGPTQWPNQPPHRTASRTAAAGSMGAAAAARLAPPDTGWPAAAGHLPAGRADDELTAAEVVRAFAQLQEDLLPWITGQARPGQPDWARLGACVLIAEGRCGARRL